MDALTTVAERTGTRPAARRRRVRAVAVLGASLVAVATWIIAVGILDVDLRVSTGDQTQTVGVGPVLAVSMGAALLGWALMSVLERRTSRAATVWTAVAATVAVLSLGGPLASAATPAAAVVLVVLHVVVAAVLIPLFRRSSSGR